MGLAAGQARLLTITARKSDCEFRSMTLSHQKIALARELADISNEYQNSLNLTKLVYDYYGTGDTGMQLSYGILMTPSALNDYMPTIVTDSLGRVALNGKYAAAALAAGIPQEGLETLPSETMRNNFIMQLCGQGILSEDLTTTVLQLPYNQAAGFGGGVTVAAQTQSGSWDTLKRALSNYSFSVSQDDLAQYGNGTKKTNAKGKDDKIDVRVTTSNKDNEHDRQCESAELTFDRLLSDEKEDQLYLTYEGIKGEQSPVFGAAVMLNYLTNSGGYIEQIYEVFSDLLDVGDGISGTALEYAYMKTMSLFTEGDTASTNYKSTDSDGKSPKELMMDWLYNDCGKDTDEKTEYSEGFVKDFLDPVGTRVQGKCSDDEEYQEWIAKASINFVGLTYIGSEKGGGDDGNDHATGAINLNNIAKAFLTFFVDYINGIGAVDENGKDMYYANIGAISSDTNLKDYDLNKKAPQKNKLVNKDSDFNYTIKIGSFISSDACALATFYDALFNQICANGWTNNKNIEDNNYLQQMLQNGMLYISRTKDDGYYYQSNYATDLYIKQISDETKIAQAEAKYNTEKAKLNAKEETLDLKMKNLDTEISALTTEYDTVKNAISKNIEKSFKRYG